MSNNLKGSLMLIVAAIIWGSTFVAQEEAAEFIGSFTLNSMRSFVGALALVPVVLVFKASRENKTGQKEKILTKPLIIGGICCGVALSVAANLQQFGIIFNAEQAQGDSGKAGFITAMYIIFVPIIWVFAGKKIRISVVLGAIVAVFGLYFISVKEGFSVSKGDIVLLLCAVAFSLHIIVVDYFVARVDGVALSCIQFLTVGIISGALMLVFERDTLSFHNIFSATIPILYCGLLSSGIAYTLQIISQKFCEPAVASLVMSLESVFAMISACVFYSIVNNRLMLPTGREFIGCALMMVAIFLVETPFADKAFDKISKRRIKNAD